MSGLRSSLGVWLALCLFAGGLCVSVAAEARPKRAKTKAAKPARVTTAPTPEAATPKPVRSAPTEPISVPVAAPKPGAAASHAPPAERESKIEFDERLVQGQTASGAIYLFQRGESEFLSMIKVPATFRERTMNQVYAGSRKPAKGR